MIWVRLRETARKVSIALPASVPHRSVDGDTLILIPGSSREITKDEWLHVISEHPQVAASIDLLG